MGHLWLSVARLANFAKTPGWASDTLRTPSTTPEPTTPGPNRPIFATLRTFRVMKLRRLRSRADSQSFYFAALRFLVRFVIAGNRLVPSGTDSILGADLS